jgi:phosphoserine phosphatase
MTQTQKIICLSAIGTDSPGLVSVITSRVLELGGNIIDVEETCRRGLFSIFLVIDFTSSPEDSKAVCSSLSSLGDETGLKVILSPYEDTRSEKTPAIPAHIVTITGMDRPGIIARVSSFFHARCINIESCRMIARGRFFSMEMSIEIPRTEGRDGKSIEDDLNLMKGELKDLCADMDQSVVIQREDLYRKMKKVVVFDVETSLIRDPSWNRTRLETLLRSSGYDIALEDDERDEAGTLAENARRLKGVPADLREGLDADTPLNPGTLELIRILKSMGFKIALLSSGFDLFTREIFQTAGADYAFSNTLKVDEQGLLTGELQEPVLTGETKKEILEFVMKLEKVSPDQVIAVGDGSSRSRFTANAGLSIAFRPNGRTDHADCVLSSDDMTNVLYCLGLPKAELERYL